MKAILEFDINDRDDRVAHLRAIKSLDMASVLWDVDQYLRSQTKYAPDSMSPEAYDAFLEARDKLHEIMGDHSIDLDELIN